MKVYIGNKEYNFSQEQLDYMYLDEGMEATIYRLDSKVLKIYKDYSQKERLDYDEAAILSKIPAKKYLLPLEPIYDVDRNFIGYTALYKDKHMFKYLAQMPLNAFAGELDDLVSDTNLLGMNAISIEDLTYDNTIFDGHIAICDVGSFTTNDFSLDTLKQDNYDKLNTYICEEILANCVSLTRKQKIFLSKIAENYDIRKEVSKDDSKTVGAFVKKITH